MEALRGYDNEYTGLTEFGKSSLFVVIFQAASIPIHQVNSLVAKGLQTGASRLVLCLLSA